MSDQQRQDNICNFSSTTISQQQNLLAAASSTVSDPLASTISDPSIASTISDPSPSSQQPLNDLNLNTDTDLVNLVDLNSPRQAGDGEESLQGVRAAASALQSAVGQSSFPIDPLTPTPTPAAAQKIATNQQQGGDRVVGADDSGSSQLNPPSLSNLLGGVVDDDSGPETETDQSFSTNRFIQNPIGRSSRPEQQAAPPTYFPLVEDLQTTTTEGGAAAAESDFTTENNFLRQGPLIPQNQPSSEQQQQPLLQQQQQQITWKPNRKLLQDIVGLGFSEICAEKALFYTGNESADLAVGWILDNPDSQTDQTPLCYEGRIDDSREASRGSLPSSAGSSPDPVDVPYDQWRTTGTIAQGGAYSDEANMFKMVFAVNGSLKMGLGKIAAQVGHATLALYRDVELRDNGAEVLMQWIENGETKVVLRADGSEHLAELEHRARNNGLPCYLVHDAGRTQIAAGSPTVLSIFGRSTKVDEVTGSLKLM